MIDYSKYVTYNPHTGIMIWKERDSSSFPTMRSYRTWRARFMGKEAGSRSNGRLQIYIEGIKTGVHRVAWILMNGAIPDGMVIDHINGRPMDNRLCNLRLCHQRQNTLNKSIQKNNTSGIKGVSYCRRSGRWGARIMSGKKYLYLGHFDTKGMAAVAYAKASMRYHGQYGRIR